MKRLRTKLTGNAFGSKNAFTRHPTASTVAIPVDVQRSYSDPVVAQSTAFRNSCLQGAYLIIAARALGLDCGPMSGFSNEAVDSEFFASTRIKSNFICSVGYGSNENLFPPQLEIDVRGSRTLCLKGRQNE